MPVSFSRIDHVHLAMSAGEEEPARSFYRDRLGVTEILKPLELGKCGGCWFSSGSERTHSSIEADFHPARKAHPAWCCRDYHELVARLRASNAEVKDDHNVAGVCRCHLCDPFGNRIELIAS